MTKHSLSRLSVAIGLICGCMTSAHALDLIQSYRLAQDQDATYQAAKADTEAVREEKAQAIGQLLPNISISGSKANADSASANALTKYQYGKPVGYISEGFTASVRQPLFRPYNFALYRQADAQVSSAEASLDNSRRDLLVRVSGGYFEALLAEHQLELILATKEAYATQLTGAKRSFELGTGTRTDIDDAQARYDMSIAQELEARQNVEYTRRQLQMIVNQPVNTLATLQPNRMELIPPNPERLEDWISRGEEVNPELRALRSNINVAEEEVSKARAGHLPTIDAFAQRSKSQSENNYTINQTYLNNQVGIQFSIPIFSGGYTQSTVRQALANVEKARQQYEAKRRDIGIQIRKEYQNVTEGILKIRALEQAERSADQAVLSNQKGMLAGTRTQIDILNAQQQRMNTKRDLAQARYLYVMARIRLQGLVGNLNEDELQLINSWLAEMSPGQSMQTAMTR